VRVCCHLAWSKHHHHQYYTMCACVGDSCSSSPQRNINTIEQFAAMKEMERRLLVRSLSDEEYLDILAVCSTFPHVDITAETQGGQG